MPIYLFSARLGGIKWYMHSTYFTKQFSWRPWEWPEQD
jgi:hypothetical protein